MSGHDARPSDHRFALRFAQVSEPATGAQAGSNCTKSDFGERNASPAMCAGRDDLFAWERAFWPGPEVPSGLCLTTLRICMVPMTSSRTTLSRLKP